MSAGFQMILLYQDYVYNNGALFEALTRHYGVSAVAYADAADIRNGILTSAVKAFIMPGGASRYVADKLNGNGNARIRSYVEQGGLYVGICAGAYYACRHTAWHSDRDDAIETDNELAFFDGMAVGPIAQFANAQTDADCSAAYTRLLTDQNETVLTLYRDGPLFHAESFKDCDVLARYADLPGQPPAIVAGRVGRGRYLLSSPHIEITDHHVDMMRFAVVANRMANIASLPHRMGLCPDYLASLLQRFLIKP